MGLFEGLAQRRDRDRARSQKLIRDLVPERSQAHDRAQISHHNTDVRGWSPRFTAIGRCATCRTN
eukprot:4793450-Amphidinium_carterae.1